MVARIVIAAEKELEEARDYYVAKDQDLGDAFIHEFRRALDLAIQWPRAWPIVNRRRNARHIQMRRFPYLLIYQVIGEELLVIAVAHAKRRPRYWRDRLQ